MSEDETKALTEKLLQRVVTKLEVMDTRLQRVESKIEERGFDTKPIWEKALTEITEVNHQIATLNRKFDVFSSDMLNLRASQLENDGRLSRLEAHHEGSITTIE